MKVSRYFNRQEFACNCGCGYDTVDVELLRVLEAAREQFRRPLIILSACRCVAHNERTGGAANSKHLIGQAADFNILMVEPAEVQEYLLNIYPEIYGIGSYRDFTHIDVRPRAARWEG